jgi:sugar lactone lactonase YvrE
MMSHRFGSFLAAGLTVLATLAPAVQAEDYAISTFAGTGLVAGGADGRPGTFNAPYGIAIDAARNLYVADTVNNTVRKITPGGVVSTLAGSAGLLGSTNGTGSAARFNFPIGIGVDAAGNAYVADSKNFIIRKITPAGEVSTFAGAPFQLGSTNGNGSAARFFLPSGLAVDSAGNVYVSEQGNHLIRKITPGGDVSTLAGGALQPGFADGAGTAARFNTPFGLAVDASGNVLVADTGNNAIRRISPAGVVSTVAGASTAGAIDGASGVARFNQPRGVAVDGGGNVYVADYGNQLLRHITAGGVVSTLAGAAGIAGNVDSVGASARFYDPTGLTADGTTVFVVDASNNLIRRGVPASTAGLPTITIQPLDQEVSTGQSVSFRVVVSGSALTYQWLKNSVAIPGATSATYTIGSAQTSDVGVFSVRISSAGGSVDSGPGTLSVTPPGSGPIVITSRPLSQHVEVGQAVSFSIAASGSGLAYQWQKNGANIAGATNATYAIASAQTSDVANYTVRVTSGAASETATVKLLVGAASAGISISSQPSSVTVNAGQPATFSVTASGTGLSYQWLRNGNAIAGANGPSYTIAATGAADAGTYAVRITAGATTVNSASATLTVNATGPAGPASRLVNLSILTDIDSAGDAFTMGYVVGGAGTSGSKSILIRAAGPTLAAAPFNIAGALNDPKIELFAGTTKTSENDNWGGSSALSTAFASVGAFAYVTGTSLDAASLANLAAGDNSVRVSAAGNGTGTVIAEVYDSTPFVSLTATSPRLVNVSVLKHLGNGLTAGFVIDGTGSKRVLIRAVGPTIGTPPFNVGGVVADPQLTLFSGQTSIGSNDNWGGTAELVAAFTQVGAFALPAPSRDAALLVTLQPGAYTVQVSGVGGTTGVAIVEVYEVP